MINSDVEIADPAVREDLRSRARTYGFSVSLARRGSSNFFMKNIFDNLKTNFRYSKRNNMAPTTRDTSLTLEGTLAYRLQFRKSRALDLFRGIQWRYWLSNLSYETRASRNTRSQYTLVGDTAFVKRPFLYQAGWFNSVAALYEPFESVKINFNLSEERDLGIDHEFRGIPIGIETSFRHNVNLDYSPGGRVFLLSEFNPRFEFKSSYAENLNPSNRKVRYTYNDTTYQVTCGAGGCDTSRVVNKIAVYDPFGTRYINNEREIRVAFTVDAGGYIMKLGEMSRLLERGAASKAPRAKRALTAPPPPKQKQEPVETEPTEGQRVMPPVSDEAFGPEDVPRGPRSDKPPERKERAAPTEPAPIQRATEPQPGESQALAARRTQLQETPAGADTTAATKADTAAAKSDTLAVRKLDRLILLRKLVRFLGSLEPISSNLNLTHKSRYERIYERASLWYQLGLTDEAGVPSADDSLESRIPEQSSDNIGISLQSSISVTRDIGLEMKGRFDFSENGTNGSISKNRSSSWPMLTLNWKGLERYGFLNRYMKQSNFVLGYTQRTSESRSGTEKSYALSPSWTLDWKNTLSSNLSVSYSRKTREKNNQEKWEQSWSAMVNLKYDIKGSKGIGIPLPILNRKKISFKSDLTTALAIQFSKTSTQIDPALTTFMIAPNLSYRFSNNVTGGAGINYTRISGGKMGQLRHSVDVQVNAEFRF
jgi:hypothetical protein